MRKIETTRIEIVRIIYRSTRIKLLTVNDRNQSLNYIHMCKQLIHPSLDEVKWHWCSLRALYFP